MNALIITTVIAQEIKNPVQPLVNSSSSNMSLYIFLGVLAVLTFLFFYFLRRTDRYVEEQEQLKQQQNKVIKAVTNEEPTEETAAAIALALSMYKSQMSDLENLNLTIQKVSRIYSPWSSKIYSLRQLPR